MNVKKIVGVLAIVLIAYFVIAQPAAASGTVSSLTASLQNAADNILQFFTNIAT